MGSQNFKTLQCVYYIFTIFWLQKCERGTQLFGARQANAS